MLLTFAFLMLAPAAASAGEIKFGQGSDSLETDDDGALTADGKKAVVDAVDRTPGEDLWETQLWARVDRGAEGPIYVEFYQTVEGKEYIVQRYEESGYEGGKYFSMNLELDGNVGFNKDRTYRVIVIQVNDKGKDVTLAKGSVKLIDSGREPEPDEEEEAEEEAEEAQDELDGLDGSTPAAAEPPPVAPSSKGCQLAATGSRSGAAAVGMLMLIGFVRRRRA